MEFLHASIALLASMVLVLAGMVGWLYWQQTRLFQNMNSIVMIISEIARPVEPEPPVPEPVPEPVDDDRVSVVQDEQPALTVAEVPIDTDGLDGKTKKELKDILTKRGIPFGPKDDKNALISLLKATA